MSDFAPREWLFYIDDMNPVVGGSKYSAQNPWRRPASADSWPTPPSRRSNL